MKFDSSVVFIPLAAFIPLLILALAVFSDRCRRKNTEKPPQSEKLLRPPGYTLSKQLDETADAAISDLFAACGLSVIAAACGQATISISRTAAPLSWLVVCMILTGLFLGLCVLCVRRAFGRYQASQDIRLGLRGEQAVAEALNEVAASGFRSFHDLPAGDNWNIDHVAVGTRGVFLIESKARRRRGSRKGQAAHEVIYDGTALQFPTYQTTKPIEQADRNAKWLAKYLSRLTGEPVAVAPLVILPGWFVKLAIKGQSPVRVMNANYLVRYLESQSETINPAQVQRIIARLDEKCRDIEF